MKEVTKIVSDIKNGNTKPIYFLMGDEPYYIDRIAEYIEENVLSEADKGFNQMVLYGRDVSIDEIVSNAKRFPMMAEKQVIIVKEAQDLSRTIDQLTSYVENPQETTVLVFCYKYKKLDKRKKLYKAIDKAGVLFESKRLYENQVPEWIQKVLAGKKYKIEPKASIMLTEYLGTDLAKINNELQKLLIILPQGATISPKDIEENIGISKDFNNFELRKAIGERNVLRANQIITHFSLNPKNHPLQVTISLLNTFFTQLLLVHGLSDKSKQSISKTLGVNMFFVPEYLTAIRNYPMRKVSQVISFLRDADVKSKGVDANVSNEDLLKELIFKIIH
ncbi:DNA polymerase III subunit delta [Aureivirga sp. CE67]|uniref:DNA polymerase III subunit delta n=1 Tax=Aureivirga sp. CE67 TaxID=1788983 RepID=UPI0018CAB707|nr:DNA polymerase III subunit delta [Aureivirga sp. CE67]